MGDATPPFSQEPPSSSDPHLVRLQEILVSCSQFVGSGGISEVGILMTELGECLDYVSDNSASDPDNENVQRTSDQMLSVILEFVKSSSTDQEVVDELSYELPKAVCKFSGASRRYLTVVETIIDQLVLRCHPRDMISFLCEALDYQNEQIKISGYVSPLLSGLAKVFISLQRRHLEQLKVAVPLIFRALEQASLKEDEDKPLVDLFDRAIDIGSSIHAVSQNLEDESRKKLQALLGLYTLQIMAYVSISITSEDQGCQHLVLELTRLLQYCELSDIELITGSAVDKLSNIIGREDEDNTLSSFSYIKHGACLSVIWSFISNGTSLSEKESLLDVTNELRYSQSKRWQAIGMLKYIFSSPSMPLRFKEYAIDVIRKITLGDASQGCDNDSDIFDSFSSIFAALQAIQMVIILSPTELKRKAFGALKEVLADIPASQRLDMLKALITNSESPTMRALLLDCVREELRKEIHLQTKDASSSSPEKAFWTESVIELISVIFRPSSGGPPFLPEESDAVLSALNLYRFILITESIGQTNSTKVLSEINLRKAYKEWFLPLMHLVTAMNMSLKESVDTEVCGSLNPLEMVLHRCIELVEEKLKNKDATGVTVVTCKHTHSDNGL